MCRRSRLLRLLTRGKQSWLIFTAVQLTLRFLVYTLITELSVLFVFPVCFLYLICMFPYADFVNGSCSPEYYMLSQQCGPAGVMPSTFVYGVDDGNTPATDVLSATVSAPFSPEDCTPFQHIVSEGLSTYGVDGYHQPIALRQHQSSSRKF